MIDHNISCPYTAQIPYMGIVHQKQTEPPGRFRPESQVDLDANRSWLVLTIIINPEWKRVFGPRLSSPSDEYWLRI